jgi:phenylalanyl-tRNA synthetase beta chain
VYGYNRFADTLPGFAGAVIEQPHAKQELAIRETLRALGFSEGVSSTFTSAEEAATFGKEAVAMGNPLSAEAGMLRLSLAPGMATMLALNLHRGERTVRLFEMGTVFSGTAAAVKEGVGLALGATGAAVATSLHGVNDTLFYEVKGAIEKLLKKFDGVVKFEAGELPGWIAEGRGARVLSDGKTIAVFGELSVAELQARKLRQPCVIATVDAQRLMGTKLRQRVSHELSRFQAVERDFSFVFPDAVTWASIEAGVRALGIAELQRLVPIEIFRDPKGKTVATGSYSLLLRVVFQSNDRTLTDAELTNWSDKIVTWTRMQLDGVQRA